jgi:hypothetical protein
MTKIVLKLGQIGMPLKEYSESILDNKQSEEDDAEVSVPKPSGISIRIQKGAAEYQSDEESKAGCSNLNSLVLGKRPVRRWEKRWILQPNVFDLNIGEIWV